ncbi:MAG: tRNA lysidine(34) synthetase TilS [Ignavibacteriaceae bacterium]
MKSIEQKVINFIKENDLINDGDRVIVALSGGPDSVFLLSFLLKFRKRFNIIVTAFHLNHLLRIPDAYKDEEFCRSFCKKAGIRFFSIRKKVNLYAKKNKLSVEEAGRKLRYALLEKTAERYKFNKIATGHTLDDNAETMLMNFFKGSGLNGLAGIPIQRGKIIRPVLGISKNEIIEYLLHYKIKFRFDESNFSDDYERNYIRNQILPLIRDRINPSVNLTLLQTGKMIRSAIGLFNDLIADMISKYVRAEDDKIYFNKPAIAKLREFLISQIFSASMLKYYGITPGSGDIKAINELFLKPKGRIRNLSNRFFAISEKDEIVIQKNSPFQLRKPIRLKIGSKAKLNDKCLSISLLKKIPRTTGKNRFTEFVDASLAGKEFIVRNWKEGDRFKPLGLNGTKKISDFLTDTGIPFYERKQVLVLTNKSDILWVVGYRINDKYKITGNTRTVLKLCLK